MPRQRPTAAVAALTVGLALLSLPAARAASPSAPAQAGCSTPLLAAPQRASTVLARRPDRFAAAAERTGESATDLRAKAADRSLWLDECGQAFFVEPQPSAAAIEQAAASITAPAAAVAPLEDTFFLESKPGAPRTIYLDFDGGTSTSAWGTGLIVEPYSKSAPADTNFTADELTEIQAAWQVVAEDYAPFDINVTTRDPGLAALDRTDLSDNVYGSVVMVTSGGPVYNSCGCGGVAYINVFNTPGLNHLWYQPAWAFTDGVGTSGVILGQVASHEAGHNFGLAHDGTSLVGYYSGSAPWAPIMGASYYQPMTQWSAGEYPNANNFQDDLAVIATGAPPQADDHGDTAGTATALTPGASLSGLIGSRSDVDAFEFAASGLTTVTVSPQSYSPDVDLRLSILDASGVAVATVDPPVARVSSLVASGLGASWSVTLPAEPANYTALVEGVGSGDPAIAGNYSDYASLGRFVISLSTEYVPTGLTATSASPPTASVGTAYSASPVTITGGTAPYAWSATGLPAGLVIDSASGQITGVPITSGTYTTAVSVTDAAFQSVTTQVTILVTDSAVTADDLTVVAKIGQGFSAQLHAAGGSGAYAWTAAGVPTGVSVSPAGVVTGALPLAGTYSFEATAVSGELSDPATVTLEITAPQLSFQGDRYLARGTLGRRYREGISIRGGQAGFVWRIVSGALPPGTRLSARGRNAVVAGTPTRRGNYAFTVRVRDGSGHSIFRRFSLAVRRR